MLDEEQEQPDEPVLQFGTAASHSEIKIPPLLVAPATTTEFNTLGLDLLPVACLSLRDILFQFGSSFVVHTVGTRRILRRLPSLRRAHASKSTGALPLVSVFGHADPVGDDEYNKTLGGRRAKAVHALLSHNVDTWEALFNTPFGDDDWRAKGVVKLIANELGLSSAQARKDLFRAYMVSLFPAALAKTDFLGRGADPQGKADFQGCGEFNPLVLLSKSELKTLSQVERDAQNQPNRRVVLFLFSADIKMNPKLWPCPTASQPTAGCRARFFPDGDQRRAIGAEHREFNIEDKGPGRTFACRFYDRISHKSPCEGILRAFRIRLFDHFADPLPGAPFRILADGGGIRDVADEFGDAIVFSTVPRRFTVLWSRPPKIESQSAAKAAPAEINFDFIRDVFVSLEGDDLPEAPIETPEQAEPSAEGENNIIDAPGNPSGAKPPSGGGGGRDAKIDQTSDRRLNNLGFPKTQTPDERICYFQRECGKNETGKLADILEELTLRHENSDPPSRYKLLASPGAVVAQAGPTAPVKGPAPTPPPATPLSPGIIDEALNEKTALLYSPKGPRTSVDSTVDKKSDDRAVWAYLPSGFKEDNLEALVFFHGNNNYVTATRTAAGAVVPRGPSWAPAGTFPNPLSPYKANAGVAYKFDKIDGLLHQPIVTLPENGVPSTGDFWGAYEVPSKLGKDQNTLGDLLENCFDRLSKLPKPSKSANYLTTVLHAKDIKRFFLMGHSGGTVPLNEAAQSFIIYPSGAAPTLPTLKPPKPPRKPPPPPPGPSASAPTGIVTDLVPFDRSFREDTKPYFLFCKAWNDIGRLGNGENKSRFISFYGSPSPNMGPMPNANPAGNGTLWKKLMDKVAAGGLELTSNTKPVRIPPEKQPDGTIPPVVLPDTDMVYIDHHTDHPLIMKVNPARPDPKDPQHLILVKAEALPTNLDPIRDALKKDYKALFIFTNVSHDFIPTAFMPLVLEYRRTPPPKP